jgi:uncharacterized membrane protein YqjE
MAENPTTERETAPSLFVSLRSFVGVILATICTRFDLATVELEEQAIFGARLVLSAIAALACVGTAFFFLMLLILAIFWDEKVIVLSIILGVYVVGAIVFGVIAQTLLARRPKLLEQTMAELRKDADGLRKPLSHGVHAK